MATKDKGEVVEQQEDVTPVEEVVNVEETEEAVPEVSENSEVSEEKSEVTEEAVVEEEGERKHKNRESTSEKAKKAAAKRAEAGESAEPTPSKKKVLDPLRLRGKKYRGVVKNVDRNAYYPLEEAIALVQSTAITSFTGSVEMHVKVKTEGVRGTVVLPHGTGKTRNVAVADDETIEKIAAGKIDFDVLLATPAQMPKLAKFAKVLGPKGLMPSPKAGTVTDDIEKAKSEIGGGRVEYRADKNGVVHLAIGKTSFSKDQLKENYQAIEQVLSSGKIVSVSLASTMGPGIRVQLA